MPISDIIALVPYTKNVPAVTGSVHAKIIIGRYLLAVHECSVSISSDHSEAESKPLSAHTYLSAVKPVFGITPIITFSALIAAAMINITGRGL